MFSVGDRVEVVGPRESSYVGVLCSVTGINCHGRCDNGDFYDGIKTDIARQGVGCEFPFAVFHPYNLRKIDGLGSWDEIEKLTKWRPEKVYVSQS